MATERIDIVVSERGSRTVRREIRGIGGDAGLASSSVNFLKNAIIALGSIQAVKAVVGIADTFQALQNRLGLVTESTSQLSAVTRELFEAANRSRGSFEQTGELYARIALSTRQLGVSQREVIDIVETLNKAVVLSGATVREGNLALIQFTQGLASGALRGDELRSVLEQLPFVADIIARQLGVTRGALRTLGADGVITADIIVEAFKNAREEVGGKFAKTIPTVEQQLQVLRNQVVFLIGTFNQQFQITQKLSSVFTFLGQNAEQIGKIAIGTTLVVALTKAVGAVKLLTLAIAANPIGAIAVGLTAATVAIVAFGDKIVSLKDGLTTVQDFLVAFGEFLVDQFSGIWDYLSQFFGELPDAASVSFEDIVLSAAQFIDRFLGVFLGGFFAIGALLQNVGQNWKSLLSLAAKGAVNAIIDALNFLPRAINALIDGILDSFKSFFLRMKLAWTYWSQAVNDAFDGNFSQAAKNAEDALFQIQNAAVNVGDNIRRAYNRYKDFTFLPGRYEITPSEENAAEQLGKDVLAAFMRGFNEPGTAEANIRGVLDRAQQLARERQQRKIAQDAQDAAARDALNTPPEPDSSLKSAGDIAFEDVLRRLRAEGELLKLSNTERTVQNELLKAEESLRTKNANLSDTQRQLLESTIRQNEVLKQQAAIIDEINGPIEELRIKQEALNQAYASGAITLEQYISKQRDLKIAALEDDKSVMGGFERGFLKIQKTIEDFGAQAEATLVNAFGAAEDALVEFVQTGEFNFSKLVDSILADLTRLLARQALFALLNAFTGGAGGSAAGLLGGLFGGARAEGGPVSPGKSYLVGENGPEIFQPSVGGTIVPNGATMAAPQVNVSVVNVTDPDEVGSALNDPRNQEIIVNIIGRNRQAVNRSLGNG